MVSCRSGMRALRFVTGPPLQRREKRTYLAPNFGATGKSAPVRADKPDQLVALVDRDKIVLRESRTANMSNAVHQQGGHVRFHLVQHWIRFHNVVPGI